jgi:hypothetical protein
VWPGAVEDCTIHDLKLREKSMTAMRKTTVIAVVFPFAD